MAKNIMIPDAIGIEVRKIALIMKLTSLLIDNSGPNRSHTNKTKMTRKKVQDLSIRISDRHKLLGDIRHSP